MGVQRNSGVKSWERIARLAEAQHGIVSRDQLRSFGKSEAAIDHAIATGRLHIIFRGVFGVGHRRIGSHGLLLAAVRACGKGSVVSHGTAAALLGLWDRQPHLIDVVAPIEAGRKIPGIRRRHTPPPLPHEVVIHDAVPCTGPSRTIVDIAGIASEALLRRTIEQAAVNRMLDVFEIEAVLAGPRRRGSRLLRRILQDWHRYPSTTRLRSRFEARLLPLLSRAGIPMPRCNTNLSIGREAFEVDFLWGKQRLVVETDGSRYHDNPQAQARDRRRDRLLIAAGYRVWRLSWHDLDQRPEETMVELLRLLQS